MIQISFVLVLAMLWALTFAAPGGADFLKVRVYQQAFTIIRVLDVLTGLGIVGLMVTMRGPLALTAPMSQVDLLPCERERLERGSFVALTGTHYHPGHSH